MATIRYFIITYRNKITSVHYLAPTVITRSVKESIKEKNFHEEGQLIYQDMEAKVII